ncbi:maleylacetate reductase [Paraburkholderia tropica]|uniref:maleylacetate reductase n=1 Tax=Paraburkholderia tropica TaxID=92647 RepID=UPI002AB0E25E|nr:maleylacetate reductase [Paraburkholderia tropica]
MKDFIYNSQATRVVFGRGALSSLGQEIELMRAERVLVLSTPAQETWARQIADGLGARAAGVFAQAVMHVPARIAGIAREEAQRLGSDCLVAVGGGSTVGLAKVIALDTGLPIVAVPTTYAGSEMTPIFGITEDNIKRTGRDLRVLPRTVIYDPDLTLDLPVELSMASAMNAIAHAAEGLYAHDGNPVMSLMAEEGIGALARAMPAIRRDAHDLEARSDALYGAWLCGSVLGNVGMALHHKLCHTLGGAFNLPHAEVHALMLPHAIAFNAPWVPEAARRIQRALGVDAGTSAAAGLFDLAKDSGITMALRHIGAVPETDLATAADLVVSAPYWNPRQIDVTQRDAIYRLLSDAWHGRRPD